MARSPLTEIPLDHFHEQGLVRRIQFSFLEVCPDALLQGLEALTPARNVRTGFVRDLADLMDKASTRIIVTLVWREDMTEILAEAKAEHEKPLSGADAKRDTELDLFIEALDNVPPHQRPLLDELLILTAASPVAGEVLEKSRLAGLDLKATIAAMRKPTVVN